MFVACAWASELLRGLSSIAWMIAIARDARRLAQPQHKLNPERESVGTSRTVCGLYVPNPCSGSIQGADEGFRVMHRPPNCPKYLLVLPHS